MRFSVIACLGALACASGGVSNEPQSAVGNAGEVSGVKTHLSAARDASTHALVADLGPIYTAPDLGLRSTVPAQLDAAYHAIMEGYGVVGIDIGMNDTRAHVMGNKRILASQLIGQPISKFLDCGRDGVTGQPRADSYRVVFSVVSSFYAVDSAATSVTTLVTGEAEDRATSASPVHCSSTGVLERALLRAAGYQTR